MTVQPLDLDALRALCDAATPGPWVTQEESVQHRVGHDDWCDLDEASTKGDAAFVAEAREALPALIAEVERLRQCADNVRTMLGRQDGEDGHVWLLREAVLDTLDGDGA